MNWIKVIEGDKSTLPPLDKIVFINYLSGFDDGNVIEMGGRAIAEDGWLWGVLDCRGFAQDWEPKLYGIEQDDDYRVTHWAEIEWPNEGVRNAVKK